uniref:Nitrilase 1 n=1 Tax=Salarias fasciatus TaxID=181472 RepID=A0A672G1M8_SALFA
MIIVRKLKEFRSGINYSLLFQCCRSCPVDGAGVFICPVPVHRQRERERRESRVLPGPAMSASRPPLAAVCQVTSTPDKEANFSSCRRLVEEARRRGACMVFLPEGFDYIGSSREETLDMSESLQGDIICRYANLQVWLSLGGFHERGPDWEKDRRIYNSHIIINDKGIVVQSELTSVYRKSHLFDVELPEKGVSLKESSFTVPGPSLLPRSTPPSERWGARPPPLAVSQQSGCL